MSKVRFFGSSSGSLSSESEGEDYLLAQPSYKVYLIDFDGTISNGHTHNGIMDKVNAGVFEKNDEATICAYINSNPEYKPITGAVEWKSIFEAVIEQQHHVAILSFNAFPGMIVNYLRDVIGLSADVVAKIHINSWLPRHPGKASKNEHILQSIAHFNYVGDKRDILLVDDSWRNIEAAQQSGYGTLYADEAGSHVRQLKRYLQKQDKIVDCDVSVRSNLT